MQICKSIVSMVFQCYFFNQLGLHYNVLLEMMMSVLQEVKGLTILHYTSSRKTSVHAKFQEQCLHGLPVLT